MVKISGARRHARRLNNMHGIAMIEELGQRVYIAADSIRAEAQHLITDGAVSGRNHVPSAPGEPPNEDTGVLRAGITSRKTGPLMAVAESAAPYAVPLETGTSKMAARPYMAPAALNKAPDFLQEVQAGINLVIRRS